MTDRTNRVETVHDTVSRSNDDCLSESDEVPRS